MAKLIPNMDNMLKNPGRKIELTNVKLIYRRARISASSGTWLCALLPLASLPGLFGANYHCDPSPYILSILALQTGVSSLLILRNFSYAETPCEEKRIDGNKKWLKYFFSHPYYVPVVISTAIICLITNLDILTTSVCCFLCNFLQHRLTRWIFDHFLDSFSVGEGLLVGQAGSLALSLCVKGILSTPGADLENRKVFQFIHVGLIIASALGYILWKLRGCLSLLRFAIIVAVSGIFGVACSSLLLAEWTPSWLIRWVLSPTRLSLVGWWTNISVMIVITAVFSQRMDNEIPRTVLRKSFHILMVLIVVPGVILDPTLTYLASTGALILFLLLEVVRVADIEPVSTILNSMFSVFLDEKDCGSLVLSHIYLLVGLSIPVWLYPCDMSHVGTLGDLPGQSYRLFDNRYARYSSLPLFAGILSVGVGDAAASVGGTYFGRHKFPGTQKTVEGTLCSVVSQLSVVGLLFYFGVLRFSWLVLVKIFFAVGVTSIVEAFTDQVDNIVLPLFMYIPLMYMT